jgi:hypothetical protein
MQCENCRLDPFYYSCLAPQLWPDVGSCANCERELCMDCLDSLCQECDQSICGECVAFCDSCKHGTDFCKSCLPEHIETCPNKSPEERVLAAANLEIERNEIALKIARRQLSSLQNRIPKLEQKISAARTKKSKAETDLANANMKKGRTDGGKSDARTKKTKAKTDLAKENRKKARTDGGKA